MTIKPRSRKLIFFAVIAAIIAALIIASGSSFLAVFTYALVAFLIIGGAVSIALLGTAFIYWTFAEDCSNNTYNEVWEKMIKELKEELN